MKSRRTIKIPRHPGIYKIEVYRNGKWQEPTRGSKFQAVVSVRDHDGRPLKKKCSFSSFAEAKNFRGSQQKVRDLFLNMKNSESNSLHFEDLVQKWLSGPFLHRGHSTRAKYKSYLKHFKFFEDTPVDRIDAVKIDQWLGRLKSPEYLATCHSTRTSYEHEFTLLKVILRYYQSGFDRNYQLPFLSQHRKALKVKDVPSKKKDLSLEEFNSFLKALWSDVQSTNMEQIYFLAKIQYAIFGRAQEAAAISVEDFDLIRGTVSVNKRVIWTRVKGEAPFIEHGLKVGSEKVIPLSEFGRSTLRDWILRSGIREGLLFQTKGNPISYRQIEYRYSKALRRAGLQMSGTHLLRHASLSECYELTKDILATKDMAGHSDLKSTQRYAKAREQSLKNAQTLIDEKLRYSIENLK